MKIQKKYIKIGKIILVSLLVLILTLISIIYTQREKLFNIALEKAIIKAKTDYGLTIKIKNVQLTGLGSFGFDDISVVPDQRDSLVKIEHLKLGIRLLPLLVGDLKLSEIKLENGKVNLIRKDGIANYDFIFRKKGTSTPSEINLSRTVNKLLNQVLYKIPDEMDIRNLVIKFKDEKHSINFFTTSATIVNNEVKSTLQVNGPQTIWHIKGLAYPQKKQLDLTLFADGKKVEIPFIQQKFGIKLAFDTLCTQLKEVTRDGEDLIVTGRWAVKNFLINHPKIASNDVFISDGAIDANLRFEKQSIALDSASIIHIKNVALHPFIRYTIAPNKIYEVKLSTPLTDAQQVFKAFPQGIFESLDGIQVAGSLAYNLHFYLNSKEPDRVKFVSTLSKRYFKILKWGKTNLQKINHAFMYTPYERGKPMRTILIGPENPLYTPIDTISPYLKNALLTAEDPSFFSHTGFVEEAIRKSIATNFEKQSFKRGGSTISMQLVKNVYLSRQKTLARKIEEMLIVWLIENGRLSTKKQLFEVYLNLIEWGPNVYGVGEAARFYFGKKPQNLNLGEGLFLTSIVPRPKSGLHFFEPDGHIRTSLRGYFKLIGGIMARRGMIPSDTTTYGFYQVRLKESLRKQLPTQPDTTLLNNEAEEKEDIFEPLFNKTEQDTTSLKKEERQK